MAIGHQELYRRVVRGSADEPQALVLGQR
jgi:hypothetical protein